ncbi:hypothetical protein VIGAN_05198300 [Vigna angularis var. angularis]|uniref:Uncharacterized protein n=1 Tax=Vigna angularis var. angularis TaxID=157739 RepID=A0A0S3S6I4_PHAAN|nr:hypothetical protein VIGAN_05198300 [Vigna angularis var. angularis]
MNPSFPFCFLSFLIISFIFLIKIISTTTKSFNFIFIFLSFLHPHNLIFALINEGKMTFFALRPKIQLKLKTLTLFLSTIWPTPIQS